MAPIANIVTDTTCYIESVHPNRLYKMSFISIFNYNITYIDGLHSIMYYFLEGVM